MLCRCKLQCYNLGFNLRRPQLHTKIYTLYNGQLPIFIGSSNTVNSKSWSNISSQKRYIKENEKENEHASSVESSEKFDNGKQQKLFGAITGLLIFPISFYFGLKLFDKYFSETSENSNKSDTSFSEDDLEISLVTRPSLGGPFVLTDCSTGKKVTDKDVFNNRWTLLYFGFSRCAEVCPATMVFLEKVYNICKEQFGEDYAKELAALRIVFISVDHIRDKPADLNNFLVKYPNVPSLGLVGTREEVDQAAKAWRVYVSSVDETDEEREAREAKGFPAPDLTDETYQLDHSAAVYFIGPDGKMKDFFFREIGEQGTADRIGMHFANAYGLLDDDETPSASTATA